MPLSKLAAVRNRPTSGATEDKKNRQKLSVPAAAIKAGNVTAVCGAAEARENASTPCRGQAARPWRAYRCGDDWHGVVEKWPIFLRFGRPYGGNG